MKVLLGVALFLLMLEIPIRAQEVQPVVQNRVASETSFSAQHFAVVSKADRLSIALDKREIVDFVFQDSKILRPYFANAKTSSGQQVTRNHPPIEGKDAMDHDTMHPGIWLAFGDINGNDYWRNKATIVHRHFSEQPVSLGNELRFTTESDLLAADGAVLCGLTNRIRLHVRPSGWLVIWDATFRAEQDFAFGDQEEMGFGARVSTDLTEKNGGTILNSTGVTSAAKTWGQPSSWCDYFGKASDREIGVMLMASDSNFRMPWWHNRNYGLMVCNAFGRKAMKQGELSSIPVKRGERFQLKFGALIHDSVPLDRSAEYAYFADAIGKLNVTSSKPIE